VCIFLTSLSKVYVNMEDKNSFPRRSSFQEHYTPRAYQQIFPDSIPRANTKLLIGSENPQQIKLCSPQTRSVCIYVYVVWWFFKSRLAIKIKIQLRGVALLFISKWVCAVHTLGWIIRCQSCLNTRLLLVNSAAQQRFQPAFDFYCVHQLKWPVFLIWMTT